MITEAPQQEQRAPWAAFACYVVAVVSLAVSLNTSWRFFDRVLHIPSAYGERFVMFAVAELALVVCGAGMAVNVHRDGRPGSFRVIVWSMCAAMAYMAWAESAAEEAVGRILLGPVLGTVMLHLGLGLELRARHQHTGAVARIARELRERCLSRLGLADDGRDAAQRTRDRKAYAVAVLSRPRRWPWSREARLERALLAAGVADDEAMRDRMLARLAVVRHAHELSALAQPSPWHHRPVGPLPSRETTSEPIRATPPQRGEYPAGRAAPVRLPQPHRAGATQLGPTPLQRANESDSGEDRAVVAIDAFPPAPGHLNAMRASFREPSLADGDGLIELAQACVDEKVTLKTVDETLEVLRLWEKKVPTTTIAERTSVHRDTVKNIINFAQKLLSDAEPLRA